MASVTYIPAQLGADEIKKGLEDGTLAWGDIPLDEPVAAVKYSEECSPCDILKVSSYSKKSSKPRRSCQVESNGIKTLIMRQINRESTVKAIRQIFDKYGPIKDIYIPKNMDKTSQYFGTVKGFALIKFVNSEDSARAYAEEFVNCTIEFAKEDR